MHLLEGIRGVLLDIDGTLLSGDAALPGAVEAVDRLRERGIPFRCVTNTTRRPQREIAAVLCSAGVDVAPGDVLAPATLARDRIVRSGRPRADLLVAPAALEDFEGVTLDDRRPDWVVVGDLGSEFTRDRLDTAFRALMAGATLLALQKNRYWHAGPELGLRIDAGAFVAALEYAAGVRAEIVGKPSSGFFRLALDRLGLAPEHVLMVGDDPENDGAGARAAGCRAALVRTGKFSEQALARCSAPPDAVWPSIAALAG